MGSSAVITTDYAIDRMTRLSSTMSADWRWPSHSCAGPLQLGPGLRRRPEGQAQSVPPMCPYGSLYLQVGPPNGTLRALIVVAAQVLAEDPALDRHAEVLSPGHDDPIDDIDENPADQCADRRQIHVSRNGEPERRRRGREQRRHPG